MSEQIDDSMPLRKGAKVRVNGFPSPTDPFNGFNFNGKVGVITGARRIGAGLGGKSVYQYEVLFENVNVPSSVRDPETRKLVRSSKVQNAFNVFEETYLEPLE